MMGSSGARDGHDEEIVAKMPRWRRRRRRRWWRSKAGRRRHHLRGVRAHQTHGRALREGKGRKAKAESGPNDGEWGEVDLAKNHSEDSEKAQSVLNHEVDVNWMHRQTVEGGNAAGAAAMADAAGGHGRRRHGAAPPWPTTTTTTSSSSASSGVCSNNSALEDHLTLAALERCLDWPGSNRRRPISRTAEGQRCCGPTSRSGAGALVLAQRPVATTILKSRAAASRLDKVKAGPLSSGRPGLVRHHGLAEREVPVPRGRTTHRNGTADPCDRCLPAPPPPPPPPPRRTSPRPTAAARRKRRGRRSLCGGAGTGGRAPAAELRPARPAPPLPRRERAGLAGLQASRLAPPRFRVSATAKTSGQPCRSYPPARLAVLAAAAAAAVAAAVAAVAVAVAAATTAMGAASAGMVLVLERAVAQRVGGPHFSRDRARHRWPRWGRSGGGG